MVSSLFFVHSLSVSSLGSYMALKLFLSCHLEVFAVKIVFM